ncbi:MAG: formate dehydrogenase accessory sulfurtransferase FdhD [Bacillota bacterium]
MVKAEFPAIRCTGSEKTSFIDQLAQEAPLTIHLNGREMVTLLCSPQHLEELAVGFLFSEGLLRKKTDLVSVKIDESDGLAWVETTANSPIAEATFLKRYITTGCGRGTSFYSLTDAIQEPVADTKMQLSVESILLLMENMQSRSVLYKETGGVHGCALCTPEELLLFREDVGRHNAADKISGRSLLDEIETSDKLLLTSGRISSEILGKAVRLGVPVLVSRAAPTALGLKLAQERGITVCGFARGRRINVYTHPQRIK